MKESYKIGPSQSSWPQEMRVERVTVARSVLRGTAGLCNELRKHTFVEADPVLLRGRQQ
jgi:hypothetical protein